MYELQRQFFNIVREEGQHKHDLSPHVSGMIAGIACLTNLSAKKVVSLYLAAALNDPHLNHSDWAQVLDAQHTLETTGGAE